MQILYPLNPLRTSEADEPYLEEWRALQRSGVACSLFDFDRLDTEFLPKPKLDERKPVLYRGWMLNPSKYSELVRIIREKGATPITSEDEYRLCHHLPGWYNSCAELTPETQFFAYEDGIEISIMELGWKSYFVKDFVKSNNSELGSIGSSLTDVAAIINEIVKYRGEIEGGIAIRRVEEFKSETERRYFVVKGQPYSQSGVIPEIVRVVASRIDAPFYSVDIVENLEGDLRVIELGDGQVSDKKH